MLDLSRSNLATKFAFVRNTRAVVDPWGIGIVVELERSDSPEHIAWIEERQAKNPFNARLAEIAIRSRMRAMAKDRLGEGDGDGLFNEAMEQIDKLEITPEMTTAFQYDAIESVARRIKNISGLTLESGADVEFSPEAIRELLSSEMWVDKGLQYGGQPLGRALLQFYAEESEKHALYRDAVVGDAGKGSAPTSGGATSTSGASSA